MLTGYSFKPKIVLNSKSLKWARALFCFQGNDGSSASIPPPYTKVAKKRNIIVNEADFTNITILVLMFYSYFIFV